MATDYLIRTGPNYAEGARRPGAARPSLGGVGRRWLCPCSAPDGAHCEVAAWLGRRVPVCVCAGTKKGTGASSFRNMLQECIDSTKAAIMA